MAGIIIPLFRKQTWDFTNMSASATQELVVAKTVDVSQWTDVELQVRVHSKTIGSSGQIEVIAYPTAPSADEPSADFVDTGTSTAALIRDPTATPSVITETLGTTACLGAVRITVKGTQDSSVPNTVTAELSAQLVAKSKEK